VTPATVDSLVLAVDAGNSRVKWSLHDGHGFVKDGRRSQADVVQLRHDWEGLPAPDKVVAANVAGEAVAEVIASASRIWGREVRFVRAKREQCGVVNLYANPVQLGADRWAALIAARALGDVPCIVICAGTAVTIDALLADGKFTGGVILPGFQAMHDALAASTAGLSAEHGEFHTFPRSTRDAISSGAIQAICGAIERVRNALASESGTEPEIVVSGGSAELVARYLQRPVHIRPRLVLEGLVRIAGAAA
jgi:type III pantothenate kinase